MAYKNSSVRILGQLAIVPVSSKPGDLTDAPGRYTLAHGETTVRRRATEAGL